MSEKKPDPICRGCALAVGDHVHNPDGSVSAPPVPAPEPLLLIKPPMTAPAPPAERMSEEEFDAFGDPPKMFLRTAGEFAALYREARRARKENAELLEEISAYALEAVGLDKHVERLHAENQRLRALMVKFAAQLAMLYPETFREDGPEFVRRNQVVSILLDLKKAAAITEMRP